MDITRPIDYRGLLLTGAIGGPGGNQPIAGIRLTRAKYSDASVHGYTEKRSLDDGMDASDVFLGMRSVSLQGEVYAARLAGLFDAIDLLRLKFTPTDAYNEDPTERGYLPLTFSQPTLLTVNWPSGFSDRFIRVRPARQPDHTIDFGAIGKESGEGFVVPFAVVMDAKDPRFYNVDLMEEFISGTSGSGTLRNRGNYPAPMNTLVHSLASQSNEAVFNLTGFGTNMTVTIPAGANDRTVRIDGQKKVVTLTVGATETLRMDLIEFNAGTTWPSVPPTPEGESPAGYDWTCTETIDVLSRMFYREAWV